ncbi:hypothetical protein PP1Y_Spl183 (plasmid) [Novosphingobium sp. PP1Y]|nr:hypothetical protein PP1Y_Spl183 [Novosphingobium sp. PP1Y]
MFTLVLVGISCHIQIITLLTTKTLPSQGKPPKNVEAEVRR